MVEQSIIVIVVGLVNKECDDTVQFLCFYPVEVNLMRSAIESGGGGEQRTGTKEKHTICVSLCVYQIYQNVKIYLFIFKL